MTIVVRDARPGEGRRIEEIRVAGWKAAYVGLLDDAFLSAYDVEPERVERREKWLAQESPVDVTLVAEVDGEVLGFAMLGPSRDEDTPEAAELYALYVQPERRWTGLGSALLVAGFARTTQGLQTVWVLEGNLSGRRFYEGHGFRADGSRKEFEIPGRPADIRYRRSRLG